MSNTPLTGPVPNWNWDRGPADVFLPADVDGDGQQEIVIYNADLYSGVLKWQDGALQLIWLGYTPLTGPVTWDVTAADMRSPADVDGDGQDEIVIYNDLDNVAGTGLLKWQNGALQPIWKTTGPLIGPPGTGTWDRGAGDLFVPADIDGDAQTEILVLNSSDLWTGVLKWQDSALQPVWMSKTPLTGQVNWVWNRGPGDMFLPADVDGDGQQEIVIYNVDDLRTGVLKWQDGALQPVWMSNTPLTGPVPNWNWDRGPNDVFLPADVDGDGQQEIVIYNADLYSGVLKWQDGALQLIWLGYTPLTGPVTWDVTAADMRSPADVDGDGQDEIVIYNDLGDVAGTGLLKWQNGALQPIWKSTGPLTGPHNTWDRGIGDLVFALDVDGDHQQEIAIYNIDDLRTGVLKWNP